MKQQIVRSWISRWLHAGILAIFILNTLVPAPALAASRAQDQGTPTPKSSETPVPEASATPTATETSTEPVSPAATPTGTPTPLPPTLGPTQTPSPLPVFTATPTLLAGEQFQLDASGGKLAALSGRVRLSFPQGIFSEPVAIEIGSPSAADLPAVALTSRPFQIRARGLQTKQELHQFSGEIAIDVDYSDLDMAGKSERDLFLYYYDPALKEWAALPSHADPATRILHAYTTHFTVFDIGINNFQASHLPSVDAFQVSQFTGAGSYSLPIEVPAGPGGLQPNLILNYNSQVIDQSTTQTQASWVGMGWSLETGSIEVNTHGTFDGTVGTTGDDTWMLNVAGVSTTIVKNTDGYHAADENFMKLKFASGSDTWTVSDKTGNVYTFAKTTQLGHDYNCTNSMHYSTFKWSLTSIRNVFGKELTYNYVDETKPLPVWYDPSNPSGCKAGSYFPVSTATYPSTIVYPNGRYRVRFEREARSDYVNSWAADNAYHSFQRTRLKTLYVEQDADGNGSFETLIRKYQLDYAGNASSNVIWPGVTWTAGGKTSTLDQVQQYGRGGSASLPATTFTYGDDMHLTQAGNGYGGSVTFDYTLWYYPTTGRLSQKNAVDFLANSTMCDTGGFVPRGTGSIVDCIHNDNGTNQLKLHGTGINTGMLNVYLFADDALRPGGVYRFSAGSPILDAHISLSYGLADGQNDNWGATFVTLPATASKADVLVKAAQVGGTGTEYALFTALAARLLPSFSRVTTKSVSDGQGHTDTFTYSYTGPAVNDSAHSADSCTDAQLNANPPTCGQYYEKYSEFRGHSQVSESGPNGRTLVTVFNQDDLYKGRPISVSVMQGSQLLTKTVYAYDSVSLPMIDLSGYIGISRNWVTTVTEQGCVYNDDGLSYNATRSDYTYESTYGNLTRQDEAALAGTGTACAIAASQPAAYRNTVFIYYPVNTASLYLTGLPAYQAVRDAGSSTILAETLNIYDSNTTFNAAPTAGKLRAVRSLTDLSAAKYSQVSYTYDTWGNRSDVTVYDTYATLTGDPSGGARAIHTEYDPAYNTYPLSQTTPPVTGFPLGFTTSWAYDYALGLPTGQTDANGATVTAAYDTFGRLTQLIKPGDDAAHPSLQVTYNTAVLPFSIDLRQRVDALTDGYYALRRTYDGLGRPFKTETGSSAGVGGTFLLYNTALTGFDAYGHTTSQGTPYGSGESAANTTMTYDALGRPLMVTAPDTTGVSYGYDGLITTVTDAKGNSTSTLSDAWGRTQSVTPPTGTGPGVSYTYDPLNQLVKATRAGLDTFIHYDQAGRKIDMIDPDMGQWYYKYDSLGNMIAQVDAKQQAINLYYDSLNRLKGKTYNTGVTGSTYQRPTDPGVYPVSYTYDAGANGRGRRTGMTDTSGSTAWTYDNRGRVSTETKNIIDPSQPAPFVTSFGYNSADLPVSMTYPDGETVTNTYTAQMLLDTVRGTSDYVTDTTYDSAGRMNIRTFGNGTQSDYDYNPWNTQGGRLKTIKSGTSAAPTSLQNLTYAYDNVGNIQSITDALTTETQAFGYDALDRLISANATNGPAPYSEIYGYNPTSGNLASKGGVNYTYDTTTLPYHPHAVESLSSGNSYEHDENGSQIIRRVGGTTYNLAYDAEGRLVTVSGGATANFTYDGDGQMVKAVKNGVTMLYVGAHYEVINPGAGQTVAKYYFAGGARVAMRKYVIPQSMALEYTLGDQLGSTSITTDANGVKVSEMRYKPWGEVRYTWTDPSLNTTPAYTLSDYTFTGQRSYTADFGLMYYNARWYDSSLGRFAQADTVVPGGVQGYDRYAYTGNNPINYTDPTGHNACDKIPDGASKDACNNTGYGAEEREKDLQARLLQDYQTGTGCGGATGDLCALGNLGPGYKPASPEVQLALALTIIGLAYAPIAIIVIPEVIAAVSLAGVEQCATNDTCRQEAAQTTGEAVDTVLSGHGGYNPASGTTIIPDGTTLHTYAELGDTITDKLGNAIETGKINSGLNVYGPGSVVPNLTLYAPVGLNIMGNPTTVSEATLLSDLLSSNMGNVHWAACLLIEGC